MINCFRQKTNREFRLVSRKSFIRERSHAHNTRVCAHSRKYFRLINNAQNLGHKQQPSCFSTARLLVKYNVKRGIRMYAQGKANGT